MSNVHPIRFCLELCFCISVRVLSFEMLRSISSEDRISALPDPIIHHILSSLPTKLSAATSILSKRWKPLWLSVPTLHFDDETFPNYDSFRHFVSFVFPNLPIRSFHLKSSQASIHHSHEVNQFVDAAAQRGGMENLNLGIFPSMLSGLPTSIFSCRTLVVLRLSGLKVNDLSQLVVDFPLLKTLHLCYVRFECFEHCIKLLSGCPILEEFERVWVHENLNETLVLAEDSQCLPNLIRANISHMSSRMASVLFTLLCRAKILCVEPVKILYDSCLNEIRVYFISNFYISLQVDYCYSHFPVFQNLIRMELILHSQLHGKWKWVIEVLKRCPKLQNLIIHKVLFLSMIFSLLFTSTFFHYFYFINRRILRLKTKLWIIGWIQQLFRNAFQHISEHAYLKAIMARSVRFNLQNILCRIQKC
jgi:hypothetical protein